MTHELLPIDIADHRDACPFHDLPPGQQVWVREPGRCYPLSAERGCVYWHEAQALAPSYENAARVIAESMDRMIEQAEQNWAVHADHTVREDVTFRFERGER